MQRAFLAVLLVSILLVGSSRTFGIAVAVTPAATLSVDGHQYIIPVSQTKDSDGAYEINGGQPWSVNVTDEYSVIVNGAMDSDPAIDYAIAVTDFGSPSSFSFNFTTPITLGSGPTQVFSSLSGSLADATTPTRDGAFVNPTGTKLQESSVNNGAGFVNMGVDVGDAMSLASTSASPTLGFGPITAGPIAGPAGPRSTIEATIAFGLSGHNDNFTASGHAEINTIPEPASLGLLAIGVLPMLRRKRA